MKVKDLYMGMPVYIDPRCSTTEDKYGFIEEMMPLLGTVQKIEYISGNCIVIKGCNWFFEDLSQPVETIKTKPVTSVLFNPKDLVL